MPTRSSVGPEGDAQGEQAAALDLGILIMDNETNQPMGDALRRSQQLAHPTRCLLQSSRARRQPETNEQPFLYALLRNEVNHP